ncbi:hypothetical protein ACN47E_002700 [Coniothyrium glycines]
MQQLTSLAAIISCCITSSIATTYFDTPPGGFRPFGHGYSNGAYPQDFTLFGPPLEAIHDSQKPSTGLAVDNDHKLYLTYPRNAGPTPNNVVICTSFNDEAPWPNATIQNCAADQDPSTCFINVQNIVRDDRGRLWVVDSGIPANSGPTSNATYRGAKLMSFDETTADHLQTWIIPQDLLAHRMNMNDMRVNTTLGGRGGYAFITDASTNSSLVAVDLDNGSAVRRLFNDTVVRADEKYVGTYDADGIALASGNFYWGVLASRRFYYISQSVLVNANLTDAEVLSAVQNPGQCGSEQAGFTADDRGRVYIAASEQNAIYYVDTLKSQVNTSVNGNTPGGTDLLSAEDYVVKTLVRSALIQHADSMAILDGWLYFNTNQLTLGPQYQYGNVDNRKGPFRSYRVWIGRGPADA